MHISTYIRLKISKQEKMKKIIVHINNLTSNAIVSSLTVISP